MLNKVKREIRDRYYQKEISNIVVGKDSTDQYSNIKDAVQYASTIATEIKPAIVLITPGQYYEANPVEISDNVILYGMCGLKTYGTDKTLSPIISGSFTKTGNGISALIGLKIDANSGSNAIYVNTPNDWENINLYISDCMLTTHEDNSQVIQIDSGYINIDNSSIMHKNMCGTNIFASGSDVFIDCHKVTVGGDDDNCCLVCSGSTVSFSSNSSLRGYIAGALGAYIGVYNSWLVGEQAFPLTLIQLDSDSSLAVENSEINNDGGGGRFSSDGTYYIWGPVFRSDESIGSGSNDIPQSIDSNLYNDCYINKFNADLCTIVKTSSGNVNLSRQNRTCIINKSSGAATQVNLPVYTNCYLGQEHIILDGKGDANSNNITISGSGATINGTATKVITAPYGRLHVIYNGTQWNVLNSMTGSTVI